MSGEQETALLPPRTPKALPGRVVHRAPRPRSGGAALHQLNEDPAADTVKRPASVRHCPSGSPAPPPPALTHVAAQALLVERRNGNPKFLIPSS